MIIYLIVMYVLSLLLACEVAFTGATRMIGRSIDDTNSYTGYQDAITPPLSSYFAITLYIVTFAGMVFGFIKYGLLAGIGIMLGFVFIMAFNKAVLLPKEDSRHFRHIIIRSMGRRYTSYLRQGDDLRASLMQELLKKIALQNNEGVAMTKKSRLGRGERGKLHGSGRHQ